jgi:putative oxidoreductase
VNVGILLLRVVLALILLAHSSQKTLGWFHGLGIEKNSAWFSSLGLQPARMMVTFAAVAEVSSAISIGTGFLAPLGAAVAGAAMLVAGLTMHVNAGRMWNAAGGGEYPYVLSAFAIGLGFIGPGRYSLDHLIQTALPGISRYESGTVVGLVIVGIAVVGAIPFALVLRRARAVTAGESHDEKA